MSSERAGVHTSGALNREQAGSVVLANLPALVSVRLTDVEKDQRFTRLLDALEACVVPDSRLARIEALLDLLDGHDKSGNVTAYGTVNTYVLRRILRGDA